MQWPSGWEVILFIIGVIASAYSEYIRSFIGKGVRTVNAGRRNALIFDLKKLTRINNNCYELLLWSCGQLCYTALLLVMGLSIHLILSDKQGDILWMTMGVTIARLLIMLQVIYQLNNYEEVTRKWQAKLKTLTS